MVTEGPRKQCTPHDPKQGSRGGGGEEDIHTVRFVETCIGPEVIKLFSCSTENNISHAQKC